MCWCEVLLGGDVIRLCALKGCQRNLKSALLGAEPITLHRQHSMSSLISRELMFRDSGGITKINMVIHGFEYVPSEGESAAHWRCRWSLEKVHPELGYIAGEDQCDCLINTFSFLGELIESLKPRGIDIWWLVEGDNGCFVKGRG